jgi:hypothetical protein
MSACMLPPPGGFPSSIQRPTNQPNHPTNHPPTHPPTHPTNHNEQGSRPVTQGLSAASELRGGDVILIGAAPAASSSKAMAGETTAAAAGAGMYVNACAVVYD